MTEVCNHLHLMVNKLTRFKFNFDEFEIPLNGIYVLFEKGETGHLCDRIVRVGTHTGKNKLRARIKEHFLKQNKDRSIFRKNVGRALLNRNRDPFLDQWDLDLTSKESRAKYSSYVDLEYQKLIESNVTEYMNNNFSFGVIEINDKEERLELESKIISTISHCEQCRPSQNWLGLSSPKDKIVKSGLWLVNELYKTQLNSAEIDYLEESMENKLIATKYNYR